MRKQNTERGAQIAELAICLPLLCFLVVAIIDGADIVRTHVLLNNAAREGARMSASTYCPGCGANVTSSFVQSYVLQYVTKETNGANIGGSTGKDAWCSATPLGVSNITVNPSASYTYDDPSIGQSVTGSASKVTIDFAYTFCYLPNFSAYFGGMSNTLPLHTEATFHNLY
jgi:Flp pilus assembly protein TadG